MSFSIALRSLELRTASAFHFHSRYFFTTSKRGRKNKRGNVKNIGDFKQVLFNNSIDGLKPSADSIEKSTSKLFKPIVVLPNPDDINLGKELAGNIDRSQLMSRLNTFFQSSKTKTLSREQGLDDYLYWQACISFRKYCMVSFE